MSFLKFNFDRWTMQAEFDPTGVWTHDLEIINRPFPTADALAHWSPRIAIVLIYAWVNRPKQFNLFHYGLFLKNVQSHFTPFNY